jgi:hypothetical protein
MSTCSGEVAAMSAFARFISGEYLGSANQKIKSLYSTFTTADHFKNDSRYLWILFRENTRDEVSQAKCIWIHSQTKCIWIRPLGLVGKAKAGSSLMTWTAWVQFPPCPDADYLLC